MSSHIMNADSSKNKYSIIAKQYCVIDTKDTIDDKSSYIQSSSEKLISNELQIDLQSVNKSKYESDTIQFLIDTKEEKTKGDNKEEIK